MNNRGGARPGAGRKPGSTKPPRKALINFMLDREVIAQLKDRVPRGQRTRFVEKAITMAITMAIKKGGLL
jgi:hypothetical protein